MNLVNFVETADQKRTDAIVEYARDARIRRAWETRQRLLDRCRQVKFVVHPGIAQTISGELVFYTYAELLKLKSISPSAAVSSGRRDLLPYIPGGAKHIWP